MKKMKNKVDELINKINKKFEILSANLDSQKTQDEIKNYLKFAGQFHNYSIRNQMLIADEAMSRGVSVEHVASFKKWSELKNDEGKKSSVKRGEKGFSILVPISYIKYQLDKNRKYLLDENGEKIPKRDKDGKIIKGLGFKAGTVFDVNQTTAKEIGAYKSLDYRAKIEIKESLFEKLSRDISDKFDINVSCEPTGSFAKGYYSYKENKIVVDSSLTTSEKISTLYHELGHHLIHGRQFKKGELDYSNLHVNRGAREGEAESFSYILSSMSGIENKSELYIKTWGNNAKDLKERFELITGVAKSAIQTLDLENVIAQEHINNVKNLIAKSKDMQKDFVLNEDLKIANKSHNRTLDRGIER